MHYTQTTGNSSAAEVLKHFGCEASFTLNSFDHAYYNKLIHKAAQKIQLLPENGQFTALGTTWKINYSLEQSGDNDSVFDLLVNARLEKGKLSSANAGIELRFSNWQEDNYLLMPGKAYNGNRFRSRAIPYSPKLQAPEDIGPDKPTIISDIPRLNIQEGPSAIQERSGAMTVPSVGFRNPAEKRGFWLLFPQLSEYGDYGITIRENRGRSEAVMGIYAPVVRELYQYRITNNHAPSKDNPRSFSQGDVVNFHLRLYFFNAPEIHTLFSYFQSIKNDIEQDTEIPVIFPFSSTFPLQEEKFNRDNYVETHGYYAVGMRENFLQDWQIGWTGGMISTYPLLFYGNETTRKRVMQNFRWLFPDGIAPSGFFYDCAESTSEKTCWYGGDIRKSHTKNWHLVRKSGDALYYILKQFMLMELQGIKPDAQHTQYLKGVADAFVKLWQEYGQFGQFVDTNTGEIVVGGSASGGIVPAGLMYAAMYYNNKQYREVAKAAATYFYDNYTEYGLTTGGIGDALQCPDSESAYALLESFTVLYEQTRQQHWLHKAHNMAYQFASWVCSYNYQFPEDTTLAKLGTKTTGCIFANAQNNHGSPGICTHSGVALLRLFRATGQTFYLRLLRDIVRNIPQMISHPGRPIPNMRYGWISERINTTDWLEGIGELMYGSTWSETSLMLAYTEIPGLYVQPAQSFIFPFDHIHYKILEDSKETLKIQISNPAEVPINLKVYGESKANQEQPWHENRLYNSPVYTLETGDNTNLTFLKQDYKNTP